MDLTTKWLIALYGWVAYNMFFFFIEKEKADKKYKKFNLLFFFNTHWDNWVITLIFSIPIVYYGEQIHGLIMSFTESLFGFKVQWYDIFYAGPGPLVELIYFIATKVWPAIKKKVIYEIDDGEKKSGNDSDINNQ